MKMTLFICCCLISITAWGCKRTEAVNTFEYKAYTEGPHVILDKEKALSLRLTRKNGVWTAHREVIDDPHSAELMVENPVFKPFKVRLDTSPEIAPSTYPGAEKMIVISDIEGNFTALYALLLAQNVIDKEGNWSYGEGHLVMLGDLFDRGPDVTPLLWLLYKLESEARNAGGYVHTLLGNHEVMIFEGDTRYVNVKYLAQSDATGIPYEQLYTSQTILGRWIRSKPAVIRVGDKLFTHAGISEDLLSLGPGLDEINTVVRQANQHETIDSSNLAYTIFGVKGIFWYRGWVDDPPSVETLDAVLDKYNAEHMVIGHTVVPEIEASFNYKLIKADLQRPGDINRSPARALGIEEGTFYEVNSLGERKRVESR